MINCVEVVSASTAKAVLMLRSLDSVAREHATNRGIGVVHKLVRSGNAARAVSTKCSRRSAVASFGSSTGSRRQAAPRRCPTTRGRSDPFRQASTLRSRSALGSSALGSRVARSAPHRREQDTAELGVTQKREGGPTMPVEVGRLSQERDEAVDPGELDQCIDRSIVHARGECTEGQAGSDLRAEPASPFGFVRAKARFAQVAVTKRGVERPGRNPAR